MNEAMQCPTCGVGVADRGSEAANFQALISHMATDHGATPIIQESKDGTWRDGMESAVKELEGLRESYARLAMKDALTKPLDEFEHNRKFYHAMDFAMTVLQQRVKERP